MRCTGIIGVAAAIIGLALAAGACGGQSAAAPPPPGASASAKGMVNASGRGVHLTVHWNLAKTVDVSGVRCSSTATTVAKGEAGSSTDRARSSRTCAPSSAMS